MDLSTSRVLGGLWDVALAQRSRGPSQGVAERTQQDPVPGDVLAGPIWLRAALASGWVQLEAF